MVGMAKKDVSGHQGPNMTPMVDIVMCILIFFMLGTTFVGGEMFLTQRVPEGPIGITDPTKRPPTGMKTAVLVPVDVVRDGEKTVVVGFGKRVELAGAGATENGALSALLSEKRAAMSADVQLNIRPGNTVPYQDVISVYDACVKARFAKVGFAAAR